MGFYNLRQQGCLSETAVQELNRIFTQYPIGITSILDKSTLHDLYLIPMSVPVQEVVYMFVCFFL